MRAYSPDEQRRLLTNFARQGSFRALALLGRKQHEIEKLMVDRAMHVGITEYGDKAFHKTLHELDIDSMEEAADLVMYEAVYSMREMGVIQ